MKSRFSAGHKEEWSDPGMEANCAKSLLPGDNNAAISHLQMVRGQISLKGQSHNKLLVLHLFNLGLPCFQFSPRVLLLACLPADPVCAQHLSCLSKSMLSVSASRAAWHVPGSSLAIAFTCLAHAGGLGDARCNTPQMAGTPKHKMSCPNNRKIKSSVYSNMHK